MVQPHDVILFFTHINETFESFTSLIDKFYLPIGITLCFCILFILFSKTQIINKTFWIFVSIVLLFFIPAKPNDYSFALIKSTLQSLGQNYTQEIVQAQDIPQPIKKIENLNIVIVLGESLRFKNMQLFGYEKPTTPKLNSIKQSLQFKTIYAGATNTDVSLPLFFNGATDPTKIDLSNNLFTLASTNHLKTTFFTTQSEKSMQYIKPYLGKNLHTFTIKGSKDDIDILHHFETVNLNEPQQFIVYQMTGQHSPYIYYSKQFNNFGTNSIINQYDNSVRYSDEVLFELINKIKQSPIPTIFIFTSDHGELLGENGQTGHNRFHNDIYTVPLILYTHNIQLEHFNIVKSHYHLYQLLHYLLGYEKTLQFTTTPTRVNGTMITGEDGFRIIN